MRPFYRKIYSGILITALSISMTAVPAIAEEVSDIQQGEDTEVLSEPDDVMETDEELIGELADEADEEFEDIGLEEDVIEENEDKVTEYVDDTLDDPDENFETENEIVTYDVVNNTDTSGYNGFYQEPNGTDWYYYTDGQISSDKNDVIEGTVNGKTGWWYVVGGKVQLDYTGVANYANSNGWWYIKDGKVDFSANTVAQNNYGWWYVVGGKVQFSYTGVANYSNPYGWWYIKAGKVDFSANTVAQNNYGWWYVTGGKVQFSYTGVANYANSYGWWYIKDGKVDFSSNTVAQNNYGWWYIKAGKVDFSANTVAQNNYGWWYIEGGKVQFSYNGFAKNSNGWWYIESGKVIFSKNSVIQDTNKKIDGKDGWWYVVGGKVQTSFNGVANYSNSYGWWYIKNGKVDFSANTVAQNDYGWWYVADGKVDFGFNGIAKNSNGWWYIKEGKVDFGYNGNVTVAAGTYSVVGGKVQNVSISGAVSSYIKDTEDADEKSYEYEVPEEYIKYVGTETSSLSAPKFTGSVNSNGTMTLTWEPVSGAAKYRVFIRKYSNGSWGSWTQVKDTTATTYTDTTWTENTLYQYTVRCLDSSGNYASNYISGYSGSAIAEYAQLFEGGPYVYGGISLTNGCDCSGFIMQVYAHFGYFLPHYSGAQIALGSEVSYANAQPGDIIGRSGHTMLYIGNGKVIHAQDSGHGICITEVSKISYTNIRHII